MSEPKMVAIHNMDPALWSKVKSAAANKQLAISAYVQQVLRAAVGK